jgi:hypothetical protein
MVNRGSAQPSTKGKKQILNTIFTWISLFRVNFAQKMDRAAATKWDPSRLEAGPVLDRLIELRVFGRKPFGNVPPYSTDDQAAERVASHLTRPPLRLMALKAGDGFICGWLSPSVAGTYVRLVSAAASSRALAICRAALAMVGPVEGEREERTLSRAWQLLTRGVRGSSNV